MKNDLIKNDSTTPISFFKDDVKEFVQNRNWKKYHTPNNLVQAIICEAGELAHLLLFKNFKTDEIKNDEKLLSNISDEVADVFIYLLSLINELDLDLTQAFENKMKKNRNKYPIKEFNNGVYYKK